VEVFLSVLVVFGPPLAALLGGVALASDSNNRTGTRLLGVGLVGLAVATVTVGYVALGAPCYGDSDPKACGDTLRSAPLALWGACVVAALSVSVAALVAWIRKRASAPTAGR
jgi:hypothetical protein